MANPRIHFVRNAKSAAEPATSRARPAPSLPRLKCLDQAVVDAADVAAGQTVARAFHELAAALDEKFLHEQRCKRSEDEPDKPRRRRARRRHAKPVPTVEHRDAPAELVRAEALGKPAAIYESESTVVAPRIRTMPPPRMRIPKGATLVPFTVDNPYHVPEPAHVVAPPAGSSANGHGPKEWQAPARGTLHVVTATRGDVLNYMHARGQIPRASFLAGRSYQTLYEAAAPLRMRSVDVSMPPISGVGAGYEAVIDGQAHAAVRLEQVHAQLRGDIGNMGVGLVMDILAYGSTIEACAEARGDGQDKQAIRFWGSFFRKCLRHLSVVLGYATASDAPRPPPGRASPGARAARP